MIKGPVVPEEFILAYHEKAWMNTELNAMGEGHLATLHVMEGSPPSP